MLQVQKERGLIRALYRPSGASHCSMTKIGAGLMVQCYPQGRQTSQMSHRSQWSETLEMTPSGVTSVTQEVRTACILEVLSCAKVTVIEVHPGPGRSCLS